VCSDSGCAEPPCDSIHVVTDSLAARDDEADVAVEHCLVEDPVAVRCDRRAEVLRERAQVRRVLPEDRVHERVQEQVGAVQPEESEQVLHPRPGAAGE